MSEVQLLRLRVIFHLWGRNASFACFTFFLTAVSVWELEEMFQELHTCLLVSKPTFSLIYVTDPLFQGGFWERLRRINHQNGGKIKTFNKKNNSLKKHVLFKSQYIFRDSRSKVYFHLKTKKKTFGHFHCTLFAKLFTNQKLSNVFFFQLVLHKTTPEHC